MKRNFCLVLSAATLLALSACGQPSTATVQNNVADARQDAAKDTDKAMQDQARTDASATADAQSAVDKADDKKADAAYDVTVTEAEGRHKVAIEKCNGLSGDAKKACKDQADATLEMAKANAKASKAASTS
jgi:Tfp pilus assembly protein PilP